MRHTEEKGVGSTDSAGYGCSFTVERHRGAMPMVTLEKYRSNVIAAGLLGLEP